MSDMKVYFHCKTCLQEGRKDHLEVGLINSSTLGVHCSTCDTPVGTFALTDKFPMICGVCGVDVNSPNHTHH